MRIPNNVMGQAAGRPGEGGGQSNGSWSAPPTAAHARVSDTRSAAQRPLSTRAGGKDDGS